MRKYRAQDFWFQIRQEPDTSGRVSRCYVIACRKCKATAKYHKTMLPDEGMRKIFVRRGWQVGKAANQHTCPDCSTPQRPRTTVTVGALGPRLRDLVGTNGAAPPPTLQSAWESAGKAEREAFVHWLAETKTGFMMAALTAPAKPHDEAAHAPWQSGSHIDSLPTQPPLDEADHPPPANATPEPEPEPAPADDDGPGADWWQEVMAK